MLRRNLEWLAGLGMVAVLCKTAVARKVLAYAWSQGLALESAQIRRIVGGQIASGDWFVPSKAKSWSEKLDQFFTAEKPLSYAKQAAGNLALSHSAAKDGLRYIGFVGLDGRPVVTEKTTPAEMWAYDVASKQPILVSNSALPLSPMKPRN